MYACLFIIHFHTVALFLTRFWRDGRGPPWGGLRHLKNAWVRVKFYLFPYHFCCKKGIARIWGETQTVFCFCCDRGERKVSSALASIHGKIKLSLAVTVVGGRSNICAAVARRVMNVGFIRLCVTPMQRSVHVLVTCKFTKSRLLLHLYVAFLQREVTK
jgi:hypothetical protein